MAYIGEAGPSVMPVGIVLPYAGAATSVPDGWLPCDGSEVSQTTYAELFAVLSTTWNTGGEGAGNFRLPDTRGKGIIGLNDETLPNGQDGGLSLRALAASGGLETLGTHGHTGGSHSHSNGLTGGSHTSNFNSASQEVQIGTGVTVAAHNHTHDGGAHTHNDFTGANGVATSQSSAGSTMSPFAVFTHIIKT